MYVNVTPAEFERLQRLYNAVQIDYDHIRNLLSVWSGKNGGNYNIARHARGEVCEIKVII